MNDDRENEKNLSSENLNFADEIPNRVENINIIKIAK